MGGKRLPILDKNGKEVNAISYTAPVAEVFADEVVTAFAPDDPAVKDIAKRFPATRDQIPHLERWLRSRLAPKD